MPPVCISASVLQPRRVLTLTQMKKSVERLYLDYTFHS